MVVHSRVVKIEAITEQISLMNLRRDRFINEGERGGCGERMATILECNSNSRSTFNTMSVLIIHNFGRIFNLNLIFIYYTSIKLFYLSLLTL